MPDEVRDSECGREDPGQDRSDPDGSRSTSPGGTKLDLTMLPPEIDPALLVDEFVSSCHEHLQQAETALLALEAEPGEAEAINTVFRAFHTIKGSSGFLQLDLVSELAHMAENLLARVRQKEISCTGRHAEMALRSVDVLRSLVDQVEGALQGGRIRKPPTYDFLLSALATPDQPAARACGSGSGEPPGPGSTPSPGRKGAGSTGHPPTPFWSRKAAEPSVRVRTDRLDGLIDSIGELVIAHSMIVQDPWMQECPQPELVRKLSHAGKIVRDLQSLGMSMRMVPLRPTFQKAARLARDIARDSGREVEFIGCGEETEIDRHMVDAIVDPLVHMIRNAVHHGIEAPDVREKVGKPRVGRIELSAFHSGGHVVIRLQDDGAGLNRARIEEKALARRLIDADQDMTHSEVFNLIFEPGLSTAEEVTEVSGRGVGMDVVRRAVAQLHGTIEVGSRDGEGTTFTLRMPLTMAVTDGMLIRVGSERFILPTTSIQMAFRPPPSALVTYANGGEMVHALGTILPLVRLHRVFGIPWAEEDPTAAILVVIDSGERRAALMVDELLEQHQVVAKPMPGGFGREHGVVGGAILGDGRVGLILEPTAVLAVARSSQNTAEVNAAQRPSPPPREQ